MPVPFAFTRLNAIQAPVSHSNIPAPTSEGENKNPRRLLQRNPLRRRRLPRRPRKARLWLTHQPQNFARSTRPSTTRPPLQKRLPITSAKLLPPRWFTSMQTCCLWTLIAKYLWNKIVREQTEADPFKDLHGMSRKGPRGLTRDFFAYGSVTTHLLIY